MWVRFVGVDCCFILLLCWFVWFGNADLLGWNARVCVGLIWAYVSSWGLVFCWIAWCLGLIFEFGFLRGVLLWWFWFICLWEFVVCFFYLFVLVLI